MNIPSVFEEAASRLRFALQNNTLETLQTSDFRVFIHEATVPYSAQQELSEDLLAVICSGQLSNNSQIVAATAYCKTISFFLQEPENILDFLGNLLNGKQFQEWTLFLCHGIFQLNCWKIPSKNGDILLEEIFSIVKKFCCDLTATCYLSFKVLHSLLTKIHELYPNGGGISEKNFKSVLEIVLSNWENPLNGVRQQNSLVLNQLLLFDQDYWENILHKATNHKTESKVSGLIKHQRFLELILAELPWTMKSKYFLLTSVAQDSNVSQILTKHGEDIIAGLTTSLSIPYLVSAGTDLYLVLLASLSLKDWQQWFFQPFSNIVSQLDPSLEVENIFNYWMNQTLKKFPSVFEDLIEETKDSLFSFTSLHQIGRKECFTEWDSVDKERIIDAVEHHSEKIRSQAMSLICTSSKTTTPPSEEEYETIQRFLKQNINSDNSTLRQNLLKSITDFILRIRDVLLYIFKHMNDSSSNICSNSPTNRCFIFLNWLHSFLLSNLENKCNYQRKITSLEIYQIVLTYFGEVKEKNFIFKRKSNKNQLSLRNIDNFSLLFKFESEESKQVLLRCLFDEDNGIRTCSARMLMSHFHVTESNKEDFEKLFKRGKVLCSDQMFYKAESGALITQVLVMLAYKSHLQEFRNIVNNENDSFISVLLISAEEQFSKLQDDLLKAASQGSFLYGTLQALELLTNNTLVPELSLNEDQVERLISLLERVTHYFTTVLALESNPPSGYAPSFGEMGMAIAAVVESSSLNSSEFSADVADDTLFELQLTPAQQLVLSCIWLNLKECSKLCSKLVSKPLSVRDSQRCVAVVVSVLCRCRHKGAIESAGLALYQITTHLTKSDKPELINQPEELLKNFLHMLVGTTAATVSRRSAGLAILVHRLITGDSRPKKPLLHLCVSRLLTVAGDTEVTEQTALVDLPQSQALHFLRTLVQESSLREHMAQYTLSISLVAVTNLASPLWTIRNAALQLFGALVPKLVGQKPNQEQGRGNYHLAFEELYTHAQPLVEMMLNEFTYAVKSGSTTSHSKLMPLLTLVTNLTLGLQTALTDDMMAVIQQFRQCFKVLFGSSIYNVRKLSSRAHALFTTSSGLVQLITETVVEVMNYIEARDCVLQSENELHGYVLNLTHLFGRFEEDKVNMKVLVEREKEVYSQLEMLSHKLLSAQCSYYTKALVFELKFPKTCIGSVALSFSNLSKHSLGYPHFIKKKLTCAVLTVSEKEVEEIADICLLKNSCYDIQYSCLKALSLYARSTKKLANERCKSLLFFLKEYLLNRKHNFILVPLIFEVMLSLLEQVECSSLADPEQFFCPKLLYYCLNALSSDDTLLPVTTIVLPFTSALLAAIKPIKTDALLKVSTLIKARTEPNFDQDIRLSAAKSISFLSELVKTGEMKKNECGELIWKACVDLLQDEVTEVRYEASKCVSVLIAERSTFVLNPYVSLELLFQHSFGIKFMTLEKLVYCLREKVLQEVDESSHTLGIINPFDHGVRRIYEEEKVISQLALRCLLSIESESELI